MSVSDKGPDFSFVQKSEHPALPVKKEKLKRHLIAKMEMPNSDKITEAGRKVVKETNIYSFESSENWFEGIAKKVQRLTNLLNMIGGWILSVMRGGEACDEIRLLNGKHAILNLAGAEHVQMQSDTGYIVDAHYLDAAKFVANLERLGGQRKTFQLEALPYAQRVFQPEGYGTVPDELAGEFSGFQFPENSANTDEVIKIFNGMGGWNSNWGLITIRETLYLVPKDGFRKMGGYQWGTYGLKSNDVSDKPKKDEEKSAEDRGVVLLSQGLAVHYEGNLSEVLTFVLEGINVMAYNIPGNGMSQGPADQENINASIEAAYHFLKEVKNIPDEKILAKGLCFGAAPTAWLGRKYPQINLMLDQNPANFRDLMPKAVNMFADLVFPAGSKPEGIQEHFYSMVANLVRDNSVIQGIAVAIFKGYDVATDLSYNEGHKLLHRDIPQIDDQGLNVGGDELVPEHHPSLLLEAVKKIEGKEIYQTVNPGGAHGQAWWRHNADVKGPSCFDEVVRFLKEADLKRELF